MTSPLVRLLSNGNGAWFAQCSWCRGSGPAMPTLDDLRLLAAAKAEGWRTYRLEAEGWFALVCPWCRGRGRGVPAVS